jgi:hypothetical protein
MEFINLTPHSLSVFDGEGKNLVITLPPSGQVARVAVKNELVEIEGEIPLFSTTYGQVEGLPEAKEGTILVVSLLVRSALPGRTDLASPGELIRDPEGKPLGCKGLAVNR